MQAAFIAEYLVDLNATQAAIRAGYSARTAHAAGNRLLKEPEIAAAIAEAMAKRSEKTGITAERVLEEFAKIGFADIRQIFSPAGGLRLPSELEDDAAASIASIEVVVRPSGEVDEDGNRQVEHVHKIKTWDKVAALTQIGRHLGMFNDKLEVNVGAELAARLAAARARGKRQG